MTKQPPACEKQKPASNNTCVVFIVQKADDKNKRRLFSSSAVMVRLVLFFQISDFLAAFFQNRKDVLQRNLLLHHQHCQMVQQIANLIFRIDPNAVFGGDDGFGAFLTAFFKILSSPWENK